MPQEIDEKALEQFTKLLPENLQTEGFAYFRHFFEIRRGLFLIQKEKMVLSSLDVCEWIDLLGQAEKQYYLNTGVDKETDLAAISLSYPLIICDVQVRVYDRKFILPVLIDGFKRLRKAYLEGLGKLPCYYIEYPLSKLVDINYFNYCDDEETD